MQNPLKQHEVLRWASLFLEQYQREPRVAELLLQYHLGVNRSQFFAKMRDTIPKQILKPFEADLIRHATTGVPLQHITGYDMFYDRVFTVNHAVLIPRPETEELVELVIHYVKKQEQTERPLTLVDVGTGSGIIAITLALELPNVKVYATDLSKEALQVAKHNAENHGATVTFLQGDFLKPVIEQNIQADLIISNPPYIAKEEKVDMADTVKNFDPELALFADDQGLAAYRNMTRQLPACINPDQAAVFFEIGHTQAQEVKHMIKETFPHCMPEIVQDINQKDRIVWSRIT